MGKRKATMQDLILYLHGSAAFQLLHAGANLRVFELLHQKPLELEKIASLLKLERQSARSLIFGLTSLGLLEREKITYHNAAAIEDLFQKGQWDLFKKMTLLQAHVMYPGQADFAESLKKNANAGIRRYPGPGKTIYEKLGHNRGLRKIFYDFMEAYSEFASPCLLNAVDFSKDRDVLDAGGGGGINSILLAKRYPNLSITLFDLAVAGPIAKEKIKNSGLSDRITFKSGDIFKDYFPKNQDAVLFIHQLVIWSLEENRYLLEKAYQSLNDNGRVVILSSISEDSEDSPLMAALDTVYFRAVAAGHGMIYPWKDYERMLKDAGFRRIEFVKCKLWTPHGVIVGYK